MRRSPYHKQRKLEKESENLKSVGKYRILKHGETLRNTDFVKVGKYNILLNGNLSGWSGSRVGIDRSRFLEFGRYIK